MAARRYPFIQVDVFTDRAFGGNPLAVFPEPAGLSDSELQAIAREMNLSETTFVFPPRRADAAAYVRIFTPASEIPFAGHPTIGTAFVLAVLGRLPEGAAEILLEERVGPVPVRLDGPTTQPRFLWMTHPPAGFGPALAPERRAKMARALGLEPADLLGGFDGPPIQVGETGLPHLYVPLRDRAAVDRARLDAGRLEAVAGAGHPGAVFIFAPEPPRAEEAAAGVVGRAYSRMFAPGIGIPEDPATGSASGPLAAYLIKEGLVPAPDDGTVEMISEQGTAMGRQSFISLRVERAGGEVRRIEVGGAAIPVIEGVLTC